MRHGGGWIRRGTTLVEVVVVLVIVGILAGIAVPRGRDALDRRSVRAAARDVALLLASARQIAATSADGAAVDFDATTAIARLGVGGRTVRSIDLAAVYGVGLRASRDSLAYDARGLGAGAANLTIVVRRGVASETLFVSRLGRVRGPGW